MIERRIPNAIESAVVLRTHRDIPGQIARERVIVIPENSIADFETRQLPNLGDFRIRYNPKGELFIGSFRETGIELELPESATTYQLGFDRAKVAKARWSRLPDVETAIRYTDHIAENYDKKEGIETLSILTVHRVLRDVSKELQNPPETRVPLSELEERVIEILVREGCDRAQLQDKLYIAHEMVNAVQRDKLGRENPSRTRLMLTNLQPRFTKMLLGNEQKLNKYRYIGEYLYRERERERFELSELSIAIKNISDMGKRNVELHHLLTAARNNAFRRIDPKNIHVAPYVQVAAEARYLMYARNTDQDVEKLTIYVGHARAKELSGLSSFYNLTYDEQRQRLLEIAESIDTSLAYADTQLLEVV